LPRLVRLVFMDREEVEQEASRGRASGLPQHILIINDEDVRRAAVPHST
jgi:hypothetical protein